PPSSFPEYTEPGGTKYIYSDASFWTSGFFPGCLYLLRERQLKHPTRFPYHHDGRPTIHPTLLDFASKWWASAPAQQASRTDTHDLGFMIQPWAALGLTLDGDATCRAAIVTGARSLASRFDARVGAMRSWDGCETRAYKYDDAQTDFLVVIDNMMNLDLLYHAAALTGDLALAHIATTHAHTTLRTHVRPDASTAHLVVHDASTGGVKAVLTHQGYRDASCWARGQAWAMCGFAQCYRRVREPAFLEAAVATSAYWLRRTTTGVIAPWDFDAEEERGEGEPRDASAALVAAYAMLLVYEALVEEGGRGEEAEGFLRGALGGVRAVVEGCLGGEGGDDGGLESVVMHATINNYEHALRRWSDTGLVYADYYFLLVGNKLLEMGLVK
ncbi:Unsaturated glucuronyl hydrolase, partial [Diplodia seriata]